MAISHELFKWNKGEKKKSNGPKGVKPLSRPGTVADPCLRPSDVFCLVTKLMPSPNLPLVAS